MKKPLLFVTIFLVGATIWLYWPSGNKIASYDQVAPVFQRADEDTLVVFDVDDTLTIPSDVAARSIFAESIEGWLYRIYYWKRYSPEQTDDYGNKLLSVVFAKTPFQLIEPKIKDYIADLFKRSVKVIACTAMSPGTWGVISNAHEWRYQKLQELGIDFSLSFNTEHIIFDNLKKCNDNYPMFYKGILCAARNSKGKVIGAFLDRIGWKPKKVIFFDDMKDFIATVVDEMKRRNIPCECYCYRGAQHLQDPVDRAVARLQLRCLIERAEWLTDCEAKKIILGQEQ